MNNKGFTLIETLIYLALFAIIMGGITASVFGIIEATGKSHTRILTQEEGSFLLGKINWALSGASSITVTGSTLTINKYNFASNPLVFDVSSFMLRLKEGTSGTATNLNNDAVKVTSFTLTDIPAVGAKKEGVTVLFTLQGTAPNGMVISQAFTTTKYLR